MLKKILVTGAFGLVGSDLLLALQEKYGTVNVVAMDRSARARSFEGPIEQGDVRNRAQLEEIVKRYGITEIYHLASLLSAEGEKDPVLSWDVNINGLRNILDLAVHYRLRVFWPSSIAAFGPTTPKEQVPQDTILAPTTMYGITKVTGELLCQYAFLKNGVDARSLRYPGLLGFKAPPGNGTTEYAIHMFYGAIQHNQYTSYIDRGTVLPMMYMDDVIQGTLHLMEAPKENISVRTSYNITACHFAPEELVREVQRWNPSFHCTYQPDFRQKIAESWPRTIDDGRARKDWGWKAVYDLPKLTEVMYRGIKEKLEGKHA